MNKLRALNLIIVLLVFAVVPMFAKLQFDGDVRNRFVYFGNKDLDANREADFGIVDFRGRFGLKFITESPIYAYYKLEIGNITWGEIVSGGGVGTDGINVETKQAYLGYKKKGGIFAGRIGLIPFGTPLEAAIDTDVAGLDLRFKYSIFGLKLAYSLLYNSTNETLKFVDNDDFEIVSSNNAQLGYIEAEVNIRNKESKLKENAKVWFMAMSDTRYAYSYNLSWIGFYNEFDIWKIKSDIGFSLNSGSIDNVGTAIPVNAYFLYAKVKMDVFDIVDVFVRMNIASGNNGNIDEVNRFQCISEKGRLNTGLSILFGGSSFNQQAYFDNKVTGLDTRKNLTEGTICYTDPGLFVFEFSVGRKFKSIKFATEFVFGYAAAANPIGGNTLLGYEFDLHNKFEFAKNAVIALSVAYMIPGKALQNVYANFQGMTLGGSACFKIDGEIEFKFETKKVKDEAVLKPPATEQAIEKPIEQPMRATTDTVDEEETTRVVESDTSSSEVEEDTGQ